MRKSLKWQTTGIRVASILLLLGFLYLLFYYQKTLISMFHKEYRLMCISSEVDFIKNAERKADSSGYLKEKAYFFLNDYVMNQRSSKDPILENKNIAEITFTLVDPAGVKPEKKIKTLYIYGDYSREYDSAVSQIQRVASRKFIYHANRNSYEGLHSDVLFLIETIGDKVNISKMYDVKIPDQISVLDSRLYGDKLTLILKSNNWPLFSRIANIDLKKPEIHKITEMYSKENRNNTKMKMGGQEPDHVLGGTIVNENRFLFQGSIGEPYNQYEKRKDYSSFNSVVLTNNNYENIKEFSNGYSIAHWMHDSALAGPFSRYPVSSSPNGKKAVFLSRYPEKSWKLPSHYKIPIWLNLIDLENGTVEKVRPLESVGVTWSSTEIEWNPVNNNIVALSGFVGEKEVLLFNPKNKKFRSIGRDCQKNDYSRRLKWSPDGKQIAYFGYDGKIVVYDLKKDSYKVIKKTKDFNDFVWTEL